MAKLTGRAATQTPTFDDIFAVMSAASAGDMQTRVVIPDHPPIDDVSTRMALAVNGLLDDMASRAAQAEQEVRRLNDGLEKRQIALESANKELEAFSYSVGHDLRAPLRSIDGFSQILLEDYAGKVDSEGRHYLQHVRESAQEMARLIDDLLMLSRVNRSPLRVEQVDLAALARSALARFQEYTPERKVDVSICDEMVVAADVRQMSIVLENLLGNAWKFTSQCPIAHIEMGMQQNEQRPVYFVRDNGVGFDMKFVDRLFGVFERLHSSDDFEGTGIGLATVKRIIVRHGGTVWAEGKVGQGATVYFTLNESAD